MDQAIVLVITPLKKSLIYERLTCMATSTPSLLSTALERESTAHDYNPISSHPIVREQI